MFIMPSFKKSLIVEQFQGNYLNSKQEPITRSLHLPYILESAFARIFLFLEQFSPQASLNSQESILYSALYCVVLSCGVLCFIVLYCTV